MSELPLHSKSVTGVGVVNETIVLGSADKTISIWRAERFATPTTFALLAVHPTESKVTALIHDSSTNQVVYGTAGGVVVARTLDPASGEWVEGEHDELEWDAHTKGVVGLCVLPPTLVSVGKDGALRIYHREAGVMTGVWLTQGSGTPSALACDVKNHRVFVGTSKGAILIYAIDRSHPDAPPTLVSELHNEHPLRVSSLVFHPRSDSLYSACKGKTIAVWEVGPPGREFVTKLSALITPGLGKISALAYLPSSQSHLPQIVLGSSKLVALLPDTVSEAGSSSGPHVIGPSFSSPVTLLHTCHLSSSSLVIIVAHESGHVHVVSCSSDA